MSTFYQDLRYGARMLLKQPGFTLVAIVTLALGIGANTAIFSVVNAVVLRPLPFAEPERLVRMWGKFSQGNQSDTSPPDFLDYRAQNRAFEEFAAMKSRSFNLTGGLEPERVSGADVTANFFQTLGVKPIQGRAFLPEEEQAAHAQVVLISEGLWQRRFGGDPAVLGKTLTLDGQGYTIVGVMPNAARLPEGTDLWRPLAFDSSYMKIRRYHSLRAIGRLKRGVTLAQAQADVDVIALGLEKQYPDSNTSWRLRLVPMRDDLLGEIRQPLYLLLTAVAFVLLIACANVANLLLARTASRQKEIAIRSALGAGRLCLMRQLLTESVLLSIAGGVVGLLLAVWGTELLVKLAPSSIPRVSEIAMDSRVLGFTLLLSSITGVVFGLVPAWQTSKPELNAALKAGSRESAGRGPSQARGLLVVAEIALALVLLVGAGLLMQSFWRLQRVEPGFDPRHVLTLPLFLSDQKYDEPGRTRLFLDQLLQRVSALPGVEAAGTTTHLPMRNGRATYFQIEGHPFQNPNQPVTAFNPEISHDYLRALGIPLVKGRPFTEAETQEPMRVVIINETFAQTYFPNEDPLGKRLIIDNGPTVTCEIIGVAHDIKQVSLVRQSRATMFLPSLETRQGEVNLVLRTAGEPLALVAAVRAAVQAVDQGQPVSNAQSMEQIISGSVAEPRFRTLLLLLFAVVALGLAVVGIYGVMSYTVTQHTREIGIRMALGAQASDVLRLVVGQGLKLTLIGVAVGLLAAFGLTRLMKTLLFGVSATDPVTFALIALLLASVALLACYLPARRATKVDPMVALRYE